MWTFYEINFSVHKQFCWKTVAEIVTTRDIQNISSCYFTHRVCWPRLWVLLSQVTEGREKSDARIERWEWSVGLCLETEGWANQLSLILGVVVSWCSSNKLPHAVWAENKRHLFSPPSGAGGLKSSHCQGRVVSDGSQAGSFLAWLWCLPAILGLALACTCSIPVSACPYMVFSLCVMPCPPLSVSVFWVDIHFGGRGHFNPIHQTPFPDLWFESTSMNSLCLIYCTLRWSEIGREGY